MSTARSRQVRDRIHKHSEDANREFRDALEEASKIKKSIDPVRPVPLSPRDVHELQQKYEEQDRLCALCGHSLVFGQHERDHIIPISRGGGNELANIQLVHPWCNKRKSNKVDSDDLLRYLEDWETNR